MYKSFLGFKVAEFTHVYAANTWMAWQLGDYSKYCARNEWVFTVL